jgi:hypothetical protein
MIVFDPEDEESDEDASGGDEDEDDEDASGDDE